METTKMGFKPVSEYLNNNETPTTPKKSDKNIILSVSLLMRLMEFAKEDAKDDVALHQVLENIMAFSDGTNPLTISEYDNIVANAVGSSLTQDEDAEPEEDEAEKVDAEFADYMQNIHDSYYEGGITGDKAKECINNYCQDETMDNCCDSMAQLQNLLAGMQQAPATVEYEINQEDGSMNSCPMCNQEELDTDTEAQIAAMINASRM